MHCGFTVDENGEKMSKSKGNGVDPAEVMDKFGADVLRLWVSSVDYSQDVRISDDILKFVADAYRRLRNTFRFLLGNLADFDDEKNAVSWDELTAADRWALVRLAQLLEEVEGHYENYKFHYVFRAVYDYVVGDLSAVYMDALKDRLYAEAPNATGRRAAQTVLMNVLEVLVRILSPIISFTTEEVWQFYPEAMRNRETHPESVQLAGWPSVSDFTPAIPEGAADELNQHFATVLSARDGVTKALETERGKGTIKKSQEARVILHAKPEDVAVLESYDRELFRELFIIADIDFVAGDVEEMAAEVFVSELPKCPRCWNHRELGGNAAHPDVCERCGNALEQMGYEA